MPQNFLFPQRDQPLLLPVNMREWLPDDDLVFVVLDAVATLDLGAFYARYRADGHGRAVSGPEMMVALLLYGYFQGERSSRVIEKRCEDSDHYSEQKFLQVSRIIERFRGREGLTEADRRWTRFVTDVRNWYTFAASERHREDDTEYEHYARRSHGHSGSRSSTRRSAEAPTSRPGSPLNFSGSWACRCSL